MYIVGHAELNIHFDEKFQESLLIFSTNCFRCS